MEKEFDMQFLDLFFESKMLCNTSKFTLALFVSVALKSDEFSDEKVIELVEACRPALEEEPLLIVFTKFDRLYLVRWLEENTMI